MYLSEGIINNSYIVKNIYLDEAAKRRLEVLGMVGGTPLEILTRKKNAAMIVKVRGTRFAIGREFAQGIEVEVNEK